MKYPGVPQVPKCLKSLRAQASFKCLGDSSAKVPFKWPSKALQVPEFLIFSSSFQVPDSE